MSRSTWTMCVLVMVGCGAGAAPPAGSDVVPVTPSPVGTPAGAPAPSAASAPAAACPTPLADAVARYVAQGLDPSDTGEEPFDDDEGDETPASPTAGLDPTSYTPPDDLDGDGQPETFVEEVASRGLSSQSFLLYLSAHGCPHYAGRIEGGDTFLASAHHDVRDIAFQADDGCAGLEAHGGVYVYDGDAYVTDTSEAYTCGCPDDDPHARRDRRCP